MSGLTYHDRDSLYSLGFDVQRAAMSAQIRSYNHYSAHLASADRLASARGIYAETGIDVLEERNRGADTLSGFSDIAFQMWKDVPGLFVQFAGANPHDFGPAINNLSEAAYCVHMDLGPDRASGGDRYAVPDNFQVPDEPVATRIRKINHLLEGWDGTAAGAFAGYMAALPAAARLQSGVSISLAAALACTQRLLSAAYADIWDIGTKTRDMLKSWGSWDKGTSAVVSLSVVGVLAAVVSEIATLGAATPELLGAGAAIGSATAGLAGTFASIDLNGSSVPQIISNMKDAIEKLISVMKEENEMVNKLLERVVSQARQARKSLTIPSPKPLYAVATADITHLERWDGFYDS
jgi:hypothetical protein